MAEEDNDDGEKKSKKPLLKIILLVVLVLLLLAGAVVGTLFATGFFDGSDKKAAEEKLQKLESDAAKAAAANASEPKRVTKDSPDRVRFEHTYMEIEREMLANLTSSNKVMQVQIALMTRYDKRVFQNVKKHEFALRAVALDVMRQTREAELEQPDFRKKLAEKIRTEMNATLEKLEDFGGIEEVHFTSFVVQ